MKPTIKNLSFFKKIAKKSKEELFFTISKNQDIKFNQNNINDLDYFEQIEIKSKEATLLYLEKLKMIENEKPNQNKISNITEQKLLDKVKYQER